MADPKSRETSEPSERPDAFSLGGYVEQGGDRASDALDTQETDMGYDGQASEATATLRREAAEWQHLVAQHQEALQTEAALGKEHTRLEEIELPEGSDADEVERSAIAVAAAELAFVKAGNHADALMLQLMATPAPHADALRYKTELLRGEEYEYLGYAVDGLFDVYAADVLFFAGLGERASRDVLDQFVADLPDWLAEREQRDDAQYAKAVAAAQADTAKAMKNLDVVARGAAVEALLGDWLDAVDAGGGRLWDDDSTKGIYLVWASTDIQYPSWLLPESKLEEIRVHRARATVLMDAVREMWLLPAFVARMRDWTTFNSLNASLEQERHEMTWRVLNAARSHGIEEVILRPHA